MYSLAVTGGFVKPLSAGFRVCSADGIGGDVGRDLMGDITASGLEGRGRDRERGLPGDFGRCGETLGTVRNCVLEPAIMAHKRQWCKRDGRASGVQEGCIIIRDSIRRCV